MAMNGAATRRLYSPGNQHQALALLRRCDPLHLCPVVQRRQLNDYGSSLYSDKTSKPQTAVGSSQQQGGHGPKSHFTENVDDYKKYFNYPSVNSKNMLKDGEHVTLHGFLSGRRAKSSKLCFADLTTTTSRTGPSVQIVSSWESDGSPDALANKALRAVPLQSPVSVSGTVRSVEGQAQGRDGRRVEVVLQDIQVLNPFPKDIIVSEGVVFPPKSRHLQIRFSQSLRERLLFRAHVNRLLRDSLDSMDFVEYETPILFKSTPEGAREFIVPTRSKGLAYALPQSPQQYKQLLMASGVGNYYQFARCFRDEDLRADRQPEFTQLDLEMSFATGEDVMRTVEKFIGELLVKLDDSYVMEKMNDETVPVPKSRSQSLGQFFKAVDSPFPRISYQEAMTDYGVDKPDLRIPFKIRRIEHHLPQSFIGMITDIQNPIVEAIRIRLDAAGPKISASFIKSFMDAHTPTLSKNPDGLPAVLIYDSRKPMCGLSSLGHEGYTSLTSSPDPDDFSNLENGDILLIQARPNIPFHGAGSTALGVLRSLVYHSAVSQGLLPDDTTLSFLWVTGFPMFTPTSTKGTDPGQGGSAGFSATHHPFTAPLTDADFDLLTTDPLAAKADHYDLVVNGVELGGGSRRIHVAKLQEYVMRDILRMTDAGVARFAHLLEALRAGCPPHAGFALGFDRLVAVLAGTGSVRDVIAFPKSMRGEDLMVKAPGTVTEEQLRTYHLALRGKE